ncbi:MAG: hypothetical protein IT162_20020 [Bryobacterales bacterium]|nr:hypothetical protein [Bryobacterales bacterium]
MSLSRQALIFRRRQTQQSFSVEIAEQALPQTVHLAGAAVTAAWRSLSVVSDEARLALSRISGETTGTAAGNGFFFIFLLILILTIDYFERPGGRLHAAGFREST